MTPILLGLGRQEVGMVLEILVLTAAIYAVLRFLRSTRGFGVITGLGIFIVLFFLLLNLLNFWPGVPVLDNIVSRVAPFLVIILVVLFQPELRQGISRFGRPGLFGWFGPAHADPEILARITAAAGRMSKERIGALIALERGVSLEAYAETAVAVDAPVTAILLETLFFPGGPLHDGAVLVRGDSVVAASSLLPLTSNPEIGRRLGTRHRAAIGLTEETDAVALVVSEETGRISLAVGGEFHPSIPLDQLEDRLREAMQTEARKPAEEEPPAPPEEDPAPTEEASS